MLAIMIAEFIYPGYSVSTNYISDLGVWGNPSAAIFNPSIVLFGILLLAAAYFLRPWARTWMLPLLLTFTAIGAIGVGIFTEDFGAIHTLFSVITFLFGAITAIASFSYISPPLSYLSVLLGAISLLMLILLGLNQDLGIGLGGMERMVAYPVLLWSLAFGGHLMASERSNPSSS